MVNYKKIGAMTNVIVASILMRTWIEGPAVSLKGSPTLQHNINIIQDHVVIKNGQKIAKSHNRIEEKEHCYLF
jgi:hypothetical protein